MRAGVAIEPENLRSELRAVQSHGEIFNLTAQLSGLRSYIQVELQEHEGMVGLLAVGVFGTRHTTSFGNIPAQYCRTIK
jgi:hypothetical protein